MISYYASSNGRLEEMEQLQESCWISLTPPFEAEELARVANDFGLPPDFLTDPLDTDERSRYEREEDARLIVLNTPVLSKGDADNEGIYITVPIGLILVDDHLITITSSPNHPVLRMFIENKIRNIDPARRSHFVLRLFEQTVFRYLVCIIDNGQALEMANIYTNILNGTMSAFGSIISNNLNITIQRLTLITIILTVPMVIASFFGMNVTVPYQAGNLVPFFGIILISILLSFGVIFYFRRKRMF